MTTPALLPLATPVVVAPLLTSAPLPLAAPELAPLVRPPHAAIATIPNSGATGGDGAERAETRAPGHYSTKAGAGGHGYRHIEGPLWSVSDAGVC